MRKFRSPDLKRLLVGQHIVNGATVGVGVIAIALAASAIFGFTAGQPATLGAISASISDLPAPWREKARTMGFGFALALIATTAIQLALPWPPVALLTIGGIAFAGGMITGMGRWAVAVGMQAVIPMVFVLGFPRETLATSIRIETLFAARRPRLHRLRPSRHRRHACERPPPRRKRIDPRVLPLSARGRRDLRSRLQSGSGLWRGDPPAGGAVGAIAVGPCASARPRAARFRKPAPRRDDRHPARRFRCARRRPVRRRARSAAHRRRPLCSGISGRRCASARSISTT